MHERDDPLSTNLSPTAGAPASAADRIVTMLQRRVVTGEIEIGTWLRHAKLAEEFGVSRTPVREALRVLAAQGIVTIVPNRGARVEGLSPRDIRELGEVRADLHGLAAELAADRIDDAQLKRLAHVWDEFAAALDDPDRRESPQLGDLWRQCNEEFHAIVVEAAGNRQLAWALEEVHRRFPRNLSFVAYQGSTRRLAENLREHRELAAVIADHDPLKARRLMTAHFLRANEATARWVETRASAAR
jgi:DNA-binding GntR family transcriptional regulator